MVHPQDKLNPNSICFLVPKSYLSEILWRFRNTMTLFEGPLSYQEDNWFSFSLNFILTQFKFIPPEFKYRRCAMVKNPFLYTRVILKCQFAAFYSLVDCEFFRQTETPWSKMTNLRAATCAIFWLFVGVGNLANFFAYK